MLYKKHTGHDIPASLPDAKYTEIAALLDAPHDAGVRSHPILSAIPGVADIAAQWVPYHRRRYAEYCLEHQPARAMLVEGPALPAAAVMAGFSHLQCSVALRAATATVWEFSACFAGSEPGRKRAAPVAVMQGSYLAPWESAVVPHVEIAPAYRGKGLLPLVLDLFRDTLAGYPLNRIGAGWEHACFGDDGVDDDADPGFELGAPSVFVFKVEGAPSGESAAMSSTAGSLRKVGGNEDRAAERSRNKLKAYFSSLAGRIPAQVTVDEPD